MPGDPGAGSSFTAQIHPGEISMVLQNSMTKDENFSRTLNEDSPYTKMKNYGQ